MIAETRQENYGQRGNTAFEGQLAQRTAVEDAAFLLPYISPGMRLLDVGCGPGSITLGLAAIVAPGEVVGLDNQREAIERARGAAVEKAVTNVRFEVGDCYKLPFPDASFDACFANSVLQHLNKPVLALAEMRRVLRPGGFAGVRDLSGKGFSSPETPLREKAQELNKRIRLHNGGDSDTGAHHRELLLAAGFVRTVASASAIASGTLEETRRSAAGFNNVLRGSTRTALTEGWVTQAEVDAMLAANEAWGEREDAFAVQLRCNAIGWVD